jgi:hypothetical protein
MVTIGLADLNSGENKDGLGLCGRQQTAPTTNKARIVPEPPFNGSGYQHIDI